MWINPLDNGYARAQNTDMGQNERGHEMTKQTGTIQASAVREPISSAWIGTPCEALTRTGTPCSRTAAFRTTFTGSRHSGHTFICKAHAASKYAIDCNR